MFSTILVASLLTTHANLNKPPAKAPPPVVKKEAPAATVAEGYYTCISTLPGGKKVKTIVIIKKAKDVYIFRQFQQDGTSLTGVGMVQDGKLVVGWSAGDAKGVNVYTPSPDGKELRGVYTMLPGDGKVYEEDLTYLIPLGVEGQSEPKEEEEPKPPVRRD